MNSISISYSPSFRDIQLNVNGINTSYNPYFKDVCLHAVVEAMSNIAKYVEYKEVEK